MTNLFHALNLYGEPVHPLVGVLIALAGSVWDALVKG